MPTKFTVFSLISHVCCTFIFTFRSTDSVVYKVPELESARSFVLIANEFEWMMWLDFCLSWGQDGVYIYT